jgi:hypothetical protein
MKQILTKKYTQGIPAYLISITIICFISAVCYPFTDFIGYRTVALILLFTVSVLAMKLSWGPSYLEQSQYLRVFVRQLRKKIEDNHDQPKFIITESGVGYRFVGGEK